MPQSDNHNYNVPNKGDANWHQPLNDNFRSFDTDIEIRDTDGNKGNYTPKQGSKLLATDTGRVYEGDGSNWNAKLAQYRYSAPSSSGAAGNLVAGHASNSVGSGVSAATIAGGGTSSNPNEATGSSSTVGGGEGNVADGNNATIGGGAVNEASGDNATVGGGRNNRASGDYATVSGGLNNRATANQATVAGGEDSRATAPRSFAAGTNASADHEGCFVWCDTSQGGIASLNPDEFVVSAAGGTYIFSDAGATTGVELTPGSGSWASASSRTLKSDVDPVEGEGVLDAVTDLEISRWSYDSRPGVRHMGPMAEDFYDTFGLGSDEEQISNVDADGVAFAAIQGLAERLAETDDRLEEKEETIERQRDRIDELEAENDALEDRLAAVEAELGLAPTTDGHVPADD